MSIAKRFLNWEIPRIIDLDDYSYPDALKAILLFPLLAFAYFMLAWEQRNDNADK